MTYAGMGPDFRVLVTKARKEAAKYFHVYHENIPVLQLVEFGINIFTYLMLV